MTETTSTTATGMPTSTKTCYRCLHCTTPCASLYQQQTSSLSSIQLTKCSHCCIFVDSYLERDSFLVVLDCVLLRVEAWRHLLWNEDSLHKSKFTIQKTFQILMATSLLESYVLWEGTRTCSTSSSQDIDMSWLVLLSMIHFGITWAGINFLVLPFHEDPTRLYLAWLLPMTTYIVTILVLVWENSSTVRGLGLLVCKLYQWTALHNVVLCDTAHPLWYGVLCMLLLSTRLLLGYTIATITKVPFLLEFRLCV